MVKFHEKFHNSTTKQECIPVGCVPPVAVAVYCSGGGACLSACWDTHPPPLGVGQETPTGCGPETPPPGVGLEIPPGVDLETPQMWAWRLPAGVGLETPLGVGLETPTRPDPSTSPLGVGVGLETCNACWDTTLPCGQTDRCKNITFANYVCGR